MNTKHIELISQSLNLSRKSIKNTIELLEDGASIPFISRYRKDRTFNLDEEEISAIEKENKKYNELEKRKKSILNSIEEQGKLTEKLKTQIINTYIPEELEDIYLPYKKKKKTKASIAKANGLEPLAKLIFSGKQLNIESEAGNYINKNVDSSDNAIEGALHIIAEWINENTEVRDKLRKLFLNKSIIESKVVKSKAEEAEKYKDYFDYKEEVKKCPSHRFLAIWRGNEESFLRVKIMPDRDDALIIIRRVLSKPKNKYIEEAVSDSYDRLLSKSLENEIKKHYKEEADTEAINVFSKNLKNLLLAPPLGEKRIMAIDPGYKSGCKIVCLDESGSLLGNDTIYPHPPQAEKIKASKKLKTLVNAYKIEAVAVGNGTAGRETETLIKNTKFDREINVFVVNESGASVYSASSVAREEFPEYDVTVRGAVSIGRRLMDPLSELVKIDPKSIGVGQYQHDVDQNLLKESLDRIVESCVNKVGVNINTASKHLLAYVSGLGPKLAENIIKQRKTEGKIKSRNEIKKVPLMGNKAFEQAAGFLRIPDSKNPLDNSAVHPESYHIVNKIAKELNTSVDNLISTDISNKIKINDYVENNAGELTIKDIIKELEKPGRDPRSKIKVHEFDPGIRTINDLKEGIILNGIITNVTNFGAFVDIGIKVNGLIHISNLADKYISNPADVVSVNQQVKVKILSIDKERSRIQLSMKNIKQKVI